MYISEKYLSKYNINDLKSKVTVIIIKRERTMSESLFKMRKEMLINSNLKVMICLGGKNGGE